MLSGGGVGLTERLPAGGAASPSPSAKEDSFPCCVLSPPVGDCVAGVHSDAAGGVEGDWRTQESHRPVFPQNPWSPGSPLSLPSQSSVPVLFILLILFLCAFLSVMSLHSCTGLFSSCGGRRLLLVAARGLLVALAPLRAENRLWGEGAVVAATDPRALEHRPLAVARGLSRSTACALFAEQGSS